MPLTAFLDLTNNGAGTHESVKGKTPIIGFNHQVDADSTKIFVVRKKIDCQTPELYDFLKSQVDVPMWKLQLYHVPRSGPQENYATMKLTKAKVAWINWVMPDMQTAGNEVVHEYEDVAFSYDTLSISALPRKD